MDRRTQKEDEKRSRNIEKYTKTQKTETRRGGNPAGAESQSGTNVKQKCCQKLGGWGKSNKKNWGKRNSALLSSSSLLKKVRETEQQRKGSRDKIK